MYNHEYYNIIYYIVEVYWFFINITDSYDLWVIIVLEYVCGGQLW